jgi:hypothetical protein
MPIFHDPDPAANFCEFADRLEDTASRTAAAMRRPSEESIRTQFLDGPLPDCDVEPTSPTQEVLTAMTDANLGISDRAELIERIKRGESPTWVPNRTVSQPEPLAGTVDILGKFRALGVGRDRRLGSVWFRGIAFGDSDRTNLFA